MDIYGKPRSFEIILVETVLVLPRAFWEDFLVGNALILWRNHLQKPRIAGTEC